MEDDVTEPAEDDATPNSTTDYSAIDCSAPNCSATNCSTTNCSATNFSVANWFATESCFGFFGTERFAIRFECRCGILMAIVMVTVVTRGYSEGLQ